MKYKPLLILVATLLLSCECPYLEEDRIDSRSYISSNGDTANAKGHNGEVEEVARYNLSGHPCKPYDKGVQIVVYSDYTTKTIIIE